MKQQLLRTLRNTALLGFADTGHRLVHQLWCARDNRNFVRDNPTYAVPPARLAFDQYGHVSWSEYQRTGQAHAQLFAALIRKYSKAPRPRIMEWGCGCGRILRHMNWADLGASLRIGFDANAEAIQWCRTHLAGIDVLSCPLAPPLPLAGDCVDVIYHYSVFTHLSPSAVRAWTAELRRVLSPGGVMIGTSHGDRYEPLLLADERAEYRSGRPVVRQRVPQGRKHFLSFFPPHALREILQSEFTQVIALDTLQDVLQDVWVAIK